jgi:hypothetical protein
MYKIYFLIATLITLVYTSQAQHAGKIEMYRYMANGVPSLLQPTAHFQSAKNWYIEGRYNYEDVQTFSLYVGKNISGGKDLEFSITPMIGYSIGKFNGVSLAGNLDLDWEGFYFSSQSQYSKSINTADDNFLFSWSEIGYSITDHVFTGISAQYTRQMGENYMEAGILAGVSLGKLEIPLYMFNPFRKNQNFILGLSYEFDLTRKK